MKVCQLVYTGPLVDMPMKITDGFTATSSVIPIISETFAPKELSKN